MATYTIQECKSQLSRLITLAQQGEEVIIFSDGIPVARIVPIMDKPVTGRIPGVDKGRVVVSPDFDDPLPEFPSSPD